jgi:uncharacterized membrane protein
MKKINQSLALSESKSVLQAEIVISWALIIGVLASGAIAILGILSRLFNWGEGDAHSSRELVAQLLEGKLISDFHPLSSPSQLMEQALRWQPDIIMTLALLLLIALPIFRVALTTAIFIRERDWPFVVITLTVLSVLLSGIFMGQSL